MNIYRHGDILLKPISDGELANRDLILVHDSAKHNKKHGGEFVVAEGEVTGHAHVLSGGVFGAFMARDGGTAVLDITEEATLTHEEHGPIKVAPGRYRVGREQERRTAGDRAYDVSD